MDIAKAYKRKDGTYVVDGYHVCPKYIDPHGKYDIAEVEAYLAEHPEALIPEPVPPPPTEAELASSIRSQRDALMRANVDCYNAARWETMAEADRDKVRAYRQALLDVTDQGTFPESVEWPVMG